MAQLLLEKELQKYFGYPTFRPGQKEIIQDVLEGTDVLGVLPTGSGKSVCYQLPAMLLEGLTIVVSPLISLMIDQVKQLRAMRVPGVTTLNSFMDVRQRQQVLKNLHRYKLLYVSPELLTHPATVAHFKNVRVSLFVIDEAHCISQWGHEFRPDYLKLSTVLDTLEQPTTLALSATVTPEVQQDIIFSLKKPNMKKRIYPMDRPNIVLALEKVNSDEEKIEKIIRLLNTYTVPALIYFSSKKTAEKTAAILAKAFSDRHVTFYHGGMEQTDRIAVQQQFMNDQLDIICCTSAFGMGINKDNIRLIIHYHLPMQKESYIQEAGRAGRDGELSLSLLLFTNQDIHIPEQLIKQELPEEETVFRVFQYMTALYNLGKPFPEDLYMENQFELNEIQWRFLKFQLEKHDMIKGNYIHLTTEKSKKAYHSILAFIRERHDWKMKKLEEMVQWVNSKSCLRESLYAEFQSSFSPPIGPCCSRCGLDWGKLPLLEKKNKVISYNDWQQQLKYILQVGEDIETE